MAQKKYFQKKYDSKWPIEKTLFHGTSADCVESIWRNGFNRSYSDENMTAYGRGVYFAQDAINSHCYTDLVKGKDFGHMFISNVLVGKYAVGKNLILNCYYL